MATRTATLDYRTTGAGQAAGEVVKLSDALDRQKQRAAALTPELRRVGEQHGIFAAVTKASAEEVNRLANQLGPVAGGLAQVATRGAEAAGGMAAYAGGAQRASAASRLLNTTTLVGVSALVAGGAAAVASTHRLLEMADAYASLTAKVQIYTRSTMEAQQTRAALFDQARAARTSVESEGQLFSRLAPAVKDAGRTPADAVRIATSVSKAMVVQGATGQEATYGAIDLIHAIGSGALQGQQLRGLEKEAPVLARYIADNLPNAKGGYGVPYASLREMAAKGGISSNDVINALMRAEPQINADFEKAPKTATQAWQSLNDKIMQTVGQLSQVTGAQRSVFEWLGHLTDEADKWRQKMLLDPKSVQSMRDIGGFVGEAAGGIGRLGAVAAQHFDEIVAAGRLIISLKLGETFAGWFVQSAQAARSAVGDVEAFVQRAQAAAGAQAMPEAAAQAARLRAQAVGEVAAAEAKAALATERSATAVAKRGLADSLALQVTLARTDATVSDAAASETETLAKTAATQAARAESQAAAAVTLAKTAEARAHAANMAAEAAEAAVTAEVTLAQKAAAGATALWEGAMAALGGPIGLVTIALGGLAWGIWQSEEAYRKNTETLRDQIVISDRLKAITDAITTATWAQIPALQAQAKALRDVAQAKLMGTGGAGGKPGDPGLIQRLKVEQDMLAEINKSIKTDNLTRIDNPALFAQRDTLERSIKRDQGLAADAASDLHAANLEGYRAQVAMLGREAERLKDEIRTGRDYAGHPVSAEQIAADKAQLPQLAAKGAVWVKDLSPLLQQLTDPKALAAVGSIIDAAHSVVVAAGPDPTAVQGEGKTRKVHTPAGMTSAVNSAFADLEQQNTWSTEMWAAIAKFPKFSASPSANSGAGQVYDLSTGKPFVGYGKDQVEAAQKYLDVVRQIEAASAKGELDKLGHGQSKADLLDAAMYQFQAALAGSAQERAKTQWAELLQRLGVATEQETTRIQKIDAYLAHLPKGVAPPPAQEIAQARAALNLLDQADAKRKALSEVSPIWDRNFQVALDERPKPSHLASGDADIRAEQSRIMAAQAEADARTIADIRKKADEEEVGATAERRLAIEKETADKIQTIQIASRLKTNVELAKIERDEALNRVQREQELTDQIAGSFKRAVLSGNFSDLGSSIADEFLSALYDNLIANPIHDMIKSVVHDLFSGLGLGGGGGGIGWGQGADWTLPSLPGPLGGGVSIFNPGSWFADGRVPGYANGRLERGFIYRGLGGPRDDANLVRISDREGIINAYSTQKYAPILDLINRDALPGFADGYVPPYGHGGGGRAGGNISVSITNQGTPKSGTITHDGQGGYAINIYDAVGKPMFRQAARDGTLMRALEQAPDPVKRRG